MEILGRIILSFLAVFVYKNVGSTQAVPTFQEKEGLVVIEAESSIEYFNWLHDTTISSFTGQSYLLYQGPDYFNDPGNSKLTYQIHITTTGKYRFQWRSRIAVGTSNTEHNDSWLRFPDASDFYAEKGDVRLYPKGTGKTPNPEGSSSEGWFKVYQNVRNNWTWRASTSDRDPHNIFVEFDTAGIYLLEVAGRSKGHALDRLVLYHSSVTEAVATNINNPESVNLNPLSSSVDLAVLPIKISPNPAHDILSVELPDKFQNGLSKVMIFDALGRVFYLDSQRMDKPNVLKFTIEGLPSGMYWLQIANKKQLLQSKFIKK